MDYDPLDPLVLQKDHLQPFHKLFDVESEFMPAEGYFLNIDHVALRNEALSVIRKHSRGENFDAFIPYLAMNYFDRFISQHEVPRLLDGFKESFNLFAICCLTLAWKMRLTSFSLTDFVTKRRLNINRKKIRRMELQILIGLQWRMRSLTPICFVEFFKLDEPFNRRDVYKIIINAIADVRYTQFKPSIIAASALLDASTKNFPAQFRQLKRKISSYNYVNEVDLMRCMEVMGVVWTEPPGFEIGEGSSSGVGANEPAEAQAGQASSSEIQVAKPSSQVIQEATTSHLPSSQEIQEVTTSDDSPMNFQLNWTIPDDDNLVLSPTLSPTVGRSIPSALKNCCCHF